MKQVLEITQENAINSQQSAQDTKLMNVPHVKSVNYIMEIVNDVFNGNLFILLIYHIHFKKE